MKIKKFALLIGALLVVCIIYLLYAEKQGWLLGIPHMKVSPAKYPEITAVRRLEMLERELPRIIKESHDEETTYYALEVQKKLPGLKTMFAQAFTNTRGKHVDVILQCHPGTETMIGTINSGAETDIKVSPAAKVSQAAVHRLVVRKAYDALIVEGNFTDGVGIWSRAQSNYLYLQTPTYAAVRKEAIRRGVDLSSFERAKDFLLKNAEGSLQKEAGDDLDLNLLFRSYANAYNHDNARTMESLEILHLMAEVRSEYALVRALLSMQNNLIKNSAIIIGALHEKELVELVSGLNLVSSVWHTENIDPTGGLDSTVKKVWTESRSR